MAEGQKLWEQGGPCCEPVSRASWFLVVGSVHLHANFPSASCTPVHFGFYTNVGGPVTQSSIATQMLSVPLAPTMNMYMLQILSKQDRCTITTNLKCKLFLLIYHRSSLAKQNRSEEGEMGQDYEKWWRTALSNDRTTDEPALNSMNHRNIM